MLEALGLDSTTESVYRALLTHPEWGVSAIAHHAGLDEDVVRRALDRLTELELLRNPAGRPGELRPVSPTVGLSTLLAQTQADLAFRQRQIEQTRMVVEAISAEYNAVRPTDSGATTRLVGLDAVRVRLEELAHGAKRECLSMVGGAQHGDTLEASQPLDQLALQRGVSIRSIYQESFRNHPGTLRYAKWLVELGGHARTVPVLPLRIVIIDGEVALVPLEPSDPRSGALEIRSTAVSAAMVSLFEHVWAAATPFGDPPARDEGQPSPQERALLQLLADGHTDEAAARELGLSLRTVRRMASDLMTRLGARSRFQAGARATARGWL